MPFGPTEQSRREEQHMEHAIRAQAGFDYLELAIRRERASCRRRLTELERMEANLVQTRVACSVAANAPLIAGTAA